MNHLRLFIRTSLVMLALITASSLSSLNAQIKQISEEEVNTQKVFIDATREKILGNYETAVDLFKEVLKRDKTNDVAAYELARIYNVLEKNEAALQSIKIAIDNDPDNDWYQMFQAEMYEETGNAKAAILAFDKLLKKNPKDAFFYEKLAFLMVKSGQPAKAIEVYDQLEKNFGVHEDISTRKHRIYLGMGDKQKAADELEKLISYMPSNTDYYHMLASFHLQMGDQELANEVYQRILKTDPSDVKASMALAEQTKGEGNDLEYLISLQAFFEKSDVNIDLKIKELIPYIQKVADGASEEELTTRLIDLTEILERVHPREAKPLAAHADLLYYSGDRPAALVKYKQALKLNKSIFSIWEQILYIYVEDGNYEDMLPFTEAAIDRFPNQAKAYYFNGLAKGQLKKHKDAISSLRQALMMSRKNPFLQVDIHNHLATEYYALNQYEKSYQSFENALKLNPNNHMLLNRYSSYLTIRGENLEKAKAMSALSNELAPNQYKYQDTYGWILYRMKAYKGAKEWVSKALANGGDASPQILEHYGDILYQLKEVEEAVTYWQQALDKGADSAILEKKIADRKIYE